MFTLLKHREIGLLNATEVKTLIANQRAQSLSLSDLKGFTNAHGSSFNCLDLETIENRYLLTSAGNGAISIYDLHTWDRGPNKLVCDPVCTIGRSHEHAHKHSVETVQWYPVDAGMFLASGGDQTLTAWDPNLLLPAETYQVGRFVYGHHMSPTATEHSLIAVASESPYLKLIDLRSGSDAQILQGHSDDILCVRWSPLKPYELASGSKDNKVFMWDVRMAKPNFLVFDQHNGAVKKVSRRTVNTAHSGYILGLTFTPDGHYLLTYGSDNQLRLWDAHSGKNMQRNYGKCVNQSKRALKLGVTESAAQPCVYLPEGNKILALDVFTGVHVQTLSGHYSQVNCCLPNTANQEMYSGANDRHLLLWTPDGGAERVHLEVGRNPPPPADQRGRQSVSLETNPSASVMTDASLESNHSAQMQDTWSSDED